MKEEQQDKNQPENPSINRRALDLDLQLNLLLARSPLQKPNDWFATRTIARIHSETLRLERRALRWIWSGAFAMSLLLLFVGIEIHHESNDEIISLASLNASEENDLGDSNDNAALNSTLNDESEDAWLVQ